MCLWGFLCPICLHRQGSQYIRDRADHSRNPLKETQFERYPPWSCRGVHWRWYILCVCCWYGLIGYDRHRDSVDFDRFDTYCSARGCCCCHDFLIEDCLIGYCCCCCSLIQVTMVRDEVVRMKSLKTKVGNAKNIKRAH